MSAEYSARAPFYTYFYWAVFLFATLFMAFILHRLIALASTEEESYSMTSVSSYREQVRLHREQKAIQRGEMGEAESLLQDQLLDL